MPGHGAWVLKQENGIADTNLQNSVLAAVRRTGWRDKPGDRETSWDATAILYMSNNGILDGDGSQGEEKGMDGRTLGGFMLANLVTDRTGQRGLVG